MEEANTQEIHENINENKSSAEALQKWMRLSDKVKSEMEQSRKSIEVEFRNILGIME